MGLDINCGFIRSGNRRGIDIRYLNLDTAAHLPVMDYVVIQDSLYQFIPEHERLIELLLSAAGAQVIVSEPVRNMTGSPNPLAHWLGCTFSNPGTGQKRHRFNREMLKEFMGHYEVLEQREICGGRNMLFVLNPRNDRAHF